MMPILQDLRDKLSSIPLVNTCRIGIEANITPDDYPIVRLVPTLIRKGKTDLCRRRSMDLTVYFGVPIHAFEQGLPEVYRRLFDLEAAILESMAVGNGYLITYVDTLTDEDRLDTYKIMAVRVVVEG